MKKAFLYYSLTGNGDKVAKRFENLGFDIIKIEPKKELPKKFFFRIMTGGFKAGLNMKDKLVTKYDLSEYTDVYIGSPIWNARLSCPINTVISDKSLLSKNLTFVLYSGSGEAPKALKKINKEFSKANVIILKEPQKYNEELDKIIL